MDTETSGLDPDQFIIRIEDDFEEEQIPPHQRMSTAEEFYSKFKPVDFKSGDIRYCGAPVGSNKGTIYVCDKPYHIAVEGASGTGKTHSVNIPYAATCINNNESVVYLTTRNQDIGYLYDLAKQRGQEPVFIDTLDPSISDWINILGDVMELWRSDDPWDRSDAEMLINRLATVALDIKQYTNSSNYEFLIGTWLVTVGLIRFAIDYLPPGKAVNTLALAQILDALIDNEPNDVQKAVKSDTKLKFLLSPILIEEAQATKEGFKSVFFSMVSSSLCNPAYTQILNAGDSDITHLDEKPTTVIILGSEGDHASMTVVSVIITIMHTIMDNRIVKSPEGRAKVRVNYILDEFGSMNLPFIEGWLSQDRAKGLRYLISFQSEGQLRAKYEENTESILSNCKLKIFLGSQNKDVIERYAAQLETVGKNLICADQLRKMRCGQALILHEGMNPFFARMVDIGTQVDLHSISRERREYYEVPIPDMSNWYYGCDESDLFPKSEGCSLDHHGRVLGKLELTSSRYGANEFLSTINLGIKMAGGTDKPDLAYCIFAQMIRKYKAKDDIQGVMLANRTTIGRFSPEIKDAINEIEELLPYISQEHMDCVYKLMTKDLE